ncbi:MAG: dTDP-4-dehydrorhamnose 3,5-epimerase [Victivallales bacterium]|nr:dTDP-4-dehydrorhamnose 3,5-epimerase [Victivallales bacterium]
MNIIKCDIEGLLILEPVLFGDERGFFMETYSKAKYTEFGIDAEFVQDNHSRSTRDVIRGLHYQLNPGQEKLVRVLYGEVFDVAVDIRRESPTFGRWEGCLLSGENKRQFYVPRGFAHGFCVLSDIAEFAYKCGDYYSPKDERGIAWDDPEIAIDWPVKTPILSERDKNLPQLSEAEHDF